MNCDNCHALDETRTSLKVYEGACREHEDTIYKLREQVKRLQAVKGGVWGLSMKDIAEKYRVAGLTPHQWKYRFASFPAPIPGFLPHRYDETDIELWMEKHSGLGKR